MSAVEAFTNQVRSGAKGVFLGAVLVWLAVSVGWYGWKHMVFHPLARLYHILWQRTWSWVCLGLMMWVAMRSKSFPVERLGLSATSWSSSSSSSHSSTTLSPSNAESSAMAVVSFSTAGHTSASSVSSTWNALWPNAFSRLASTSSTATPLSISSSLPFTPLPATCTPTAADSEETDFGELLRLIKALIQATKRDIDRLDNSLPLPVYQQTSLFVKTCTTYVRLVEKGDPSGEAEVAEYEPCHTAADTLQSTLLLVLARFQDVQGKRTGGLLFGQGSVNDSLVDMVWVIEWERFDQDGLTRAMEALNEALKSLEVLVETWNLLSRADKCKSQLLVQTE